jgi:branched-subunit amino acid transport protein
MNIWLTMLFAGLLTFAMRFSIMYLAQHITIPSRVQQALRYVPPAVLSAIIAPAILLPNGVLDLHFSNTRLLAGLVAIVVAGFTRHTLLTILAGMAALFLLNWLL